MWDVLLLMLLVFTTGSAAIWVSYVLVERDFLLPSFARIATTMGLPPQLIVYGAVGLLTVFLALLLLAGIIGLPSEALRRLVEQSPTFGSQLDISPFFLGLWQQMGTVAKLIAFVLFFMSMWSVGVAAERIYSFMRAKNQSKLYAPLVAKHLKAGRLEDAIAVSINKNYRYSHLAKVVLAGLQEYQVQQRTAGASSDNKDLIETVRRSTQQAAGLTANDLRRNLSSLATIGAVAPFVGLLGTVVGVVSAFSGIAASGSAGIGAVSIGISTALVETALGLAVAILAVWIYNYLTKRIEYFNKEVEESSSKLTGYLIPKGS